jgi:hypothetical protein
MIFHGVYKTPQIIDSTISLTSNNAVNGKAVSDYVEAQLENVGGGCSICREDVFLPSGNKPQPLKLILLTVATYFLNSLYPDPAEDWPPILNNRLLLIDFIIRAPTGWSFSRLGTHCSENFFGFVRQNARAHDQSVPALRIRARSACVSLEMQRWRIYVTDKRRDNVGGVVIADWPTDFPSLSGT